MAKVIEKGMDNLRGAGFADIYHQQCFQDQFNDEFWTGYDKIDENNEWTARWAALYPLYSRRKTYVSIFLFLLLINYLLINLFCIKIPLY